MKHKKLEGASIQEMLLIKTSFCQNFMVDIIENSDLLTVNKNNFHPKLNAPRKMI